MSEEYRQTRYNIRDAICSLWPNLPTEIMENTPKRFVDAMLEMTVGYSMHPRQVLSAEFDCESDEIVVAKGIRFVSLCEHHLMPFVGTAAVAYIPSGNRVVGISKLARLVDIFAKRLQLQERLTCEITQALVEYMSPKGTACVIEAHHTCMGCRGAKQPDARIVTSSMRGCFRDESEARAEVLKLMS